MVDQSEADDTPPIERLGKNALGRHAFEAQMPAKLTRLLDAEDSSNTVSGIIDNLAVILETDKDLEVAYLCHDATVQIHKLATEGHHFCGYRNIQMLCLTLGQMASDSKHTHPEVQRVLREKLKIPHLQTMIEQAWDAGINTHARIQTGGIKGTRKDIGTSEAEALLLHLSIPCTGHAFTGPHACAELFDAVETYFASAVRTGVSSSAKEQRVHRTTLPPIFLQRPHHSVSIVGFERTKTGKRRLLVFDPAYAVPGKMRGVALREEAISVGWGLKMMMWRYRKSERAMSRWTSFEMLVVDQAGNG